MSAAVEDLMQATDADLRAAGLERRAPHSCPACRCNEGPVCTVCGCHLHDVGHAIAVANVQRLVEQVGKLKERIRRMRGPK